MKRLAILGAGGHGKVVADTAECCGWTEIDFFDDAWPGLQKIGVWSVVGDGAAFMDRVADYDGVLVAIGNNSTRYKKLRALQDAGIQLIRLIHPAATVSRYSNINEGTVVFPGVVVNAGVNVGLGCILNTGCSLDHDCMLGDVVHISPGARLAGGVRVGKGSWIGIGASVRQLIRIGQRAIVGAGAVVICDVPNDITVVGVPAKMLE